MTCMAMLQQRTPAPRDIKFKILVDLSLFIITMYLLCLGEEKMVFNEIMHFHYNDLYSLVPAQEPLPQGSWNLHFVDSSLVMISIYTYFVCSMPRSREVDFLKKLCIFTIWLKLPHPCTRIPVPGVIKFAIFVDLSLIIISTHLVCMNHAPKIY